jgi:hypothetical protein
MLLRTRKARLAAKAAKTGVGTYGALKQTQGRLEGRREVGGRGGKRSFLLGVLVGAAAVYALARGEAKTAPPGQSASIGTP